jgi:predicted amidohydrolase YtcJ
VLAADPMTVPVKDIKSITVVGTVFAGEAYEN